MALLVRFRKVREDAVRVEYTLGLNSRMDEGLAIDKATRRAAPLHGPVTEAFRAAYHKILESQELQGTWPEQGESIS